MSLSDRLVEASTNTTQPLCKIGKILAGDKLTPKDKAYLVEVLSVPETTPNRLNNTAIAKVLREENFDVSNSAVDRHRRQDCPCYRKVSA